MWNFLTFQTFIAQDILRIFYYIGAVLIPVLLWYLRYHLHRRFAFFAEIETIYKRLFSTLGIHNRIFALLGFLGIFLCMELCWRMIFEMMIGYFDMHGYLQSIANRAVVPI